MFPDNLTRDEARTRSALLDTATYRVRVDLTGHAPDGSPLAEPDTHFVSTSTVRFTAREDGSSFIDVIADEVLAARLDGEPLDVSTFAESRLPFHVGAGEHELSVTAVLRYSRSGLGLHRFVDPADDRVYLYSQFEVSEARRVYACFEQPDLKAEFTFSVLAPAGWAVISNAATPKPSLHGRSVELWEFAPTCAMSTYITAIVAGEYHSVATSYTGRGGEVPMSILCRQSLVEHLDADRIFATTQAGFGVFEEHFGRPYPFGTYDQAFVPEYNIGAMENAGCVTFRDEYIFRSRKTAAAYESRDNTILHELAHMWFGNLVTMTWWDDLWLNESFAEWASHFAQGEIGDDPEQPWVNFCNSRKTWAYRQDQLPSTHPIAADMVDLEAVELNFDGITYAKGASALRQLVAFVGRDEFLAGVRAYFAEHAFANTQLSHLLTALEASSGRDLSDWSSEWLEVAGVNTLRAEFETAADGTFSSFRIHQTAPAEWPTLRSHRLAVGLYSLVDGRLVRLHRVECDIAGEYSPVDELVGLPRPDLILVNDDDLTYAKVRLDDRSLDTLINNIHQLDSALARALCWGAAWDMCRDAELSAADYVDLVLRGVGDETDLTAVQTQLAQASRAAEAYAPVEDQSAVLTTLEAGLARLLSEAESGSDHQLAITRALAAVARSEVGADLLFGWLVGEEVPPGLVVDRDLRWSLAHGLARIGRFGDAEIDAELERDNTITGAEQAAAARAAQPVAAAKEAAWEIAVENDDVPNETQRQICFSFWQHGQDEVLAPYVDRYLQTCEDISASRGVWARKGLSLQNNVVGNLFPSTLADRAFVALLDDWLARTELSDPVRRLISERRDDALRALRCRAAGGRTPTA
ncbi:MAG: aminopeptidase N [Propionibacteriaceae bacterium]